MLILTGDAQLIDMVELVSVDFGSIANQNILVKGVISVFQFCDRNKVGFLSEYSTIYDDVFALVVVVVFCVISSLVSKNIESMKISIFPYFRLFNK